MYVCTCSTHIVKVTGVNLRGGEHDTGVSDDRGRVWINTAAPTEEERERIVKQQSPGLVSCPAPPTHPGRERGSGESCTSGLSLFRNFQAPIRDCSTRLKNVRNVINFTHSRC